MSYLSFGHDIPDIPFTKFSINQESCNGLQHKSGSRIYIPDNCLIHQDGSICKHLISIEYRELNNAVDIVISNTTMNFTDGSGNHNLESGGMFEIYASCILGNLKIAKNKQLNIRYASENNIDNLEAFIYDRNKSIWLKKDSKIQDFGVDENKKDSESLWGSPAPPPFTQFNDWDGEWMEGDDWAEFDTQEYREFQKKKTEIFKSMNIDEFGLYNYDRILKEKDRIPIIASFNVDNKEGLVNLVYVVYDGINSVLYFNKDDWKNTFALLPKSSYTIFAISKDGRVAKLEDNDKPSNLNQFMNKPYTFNLTLGKNKVDSKPTLITAIGLNSNSNK